MTHIRQAIPSDLTRIAEIEIFNYRLYFYPIFRNDEYYFSELLVPALTEDYRPMLDSFYVYDDGVVKGFYQAWGSQLKKLFVEPVLQGNAIGAALLQDAVSRFSITHLWALEQNSRAIAFYKRHGFRVTDDRILEEDTDEYLIRLIR